MINKIDKKFQTEKATKLFLSLLTDAAGVVTYFYPAIGEVGDVAWAPISSAIIFAMYRKYKGKLPATIGGFTEEAIPLTDAVPTATIMWFYTFVMNKEATKEVIALGIDS